VDDPELIKRTRDEAIKKLEGKYGMKRFLRDGHQTVVEDTSRLYYNANELKVFEDIESEWPLFFTYMVLEGLFTGDLEQAEDYTRKLQPLIVNSNSLTQKRPDEITPLPSTSSSSTASSTRRRSDSFLNQIDEDDDDENDDINVNVPLLPELYFVPSENINAEKQNPHSQNRLPNDNLPLVWANSLYFLGGLITEDLLSPSEVDPLGRRFNSSKMVKDTMIQIVLLSEDRELQSALSNYGLETQTLYQISSNTTVLPPQALVDVYAGLGLNTKLEMSGRPKR
jgi:phosphorylase kinase alpha/beta subunit